MEAVVRRHQGVYLLGMGIISILAAFFLVPLGFYVLYRALRDLSAMNAGRVDESGRDLTRLALVLGTISTLIAALGLFVLVVSLELPNEMRATRVIEAGAPPR